MRHFLAALALACALIPFAPAPAEPLVRTAQMARDVTDAVRKQRNEQRKRSQANERTKCGARR